MAGFWNKQAKALRWQAPNGRVVTEWVPPDTEEESIMRQLDSNRRANRDARDAKAYVAARRCLA